MLNITSYKLINNYVMCYKYFDLRLECNITMDDDVCKIRILHYTYHEFLKFKLHALSKIK